MLMLAAALALPCHAQEAPALLDTLKGRAAVASEAAAASPANPDLVQRAESETLHDDERILAEVTAHLSRNPAFRAVVPAVQAGVATLSGSVPDDEARQLAAKVAAAVGGVVAVENHLFLAADFGVRLHETWELLKDHAARAVATIPLLLAAIAVVLAMHWLGGWLARHLHWVRLDSRNPFLGTIIQRGVRAVFLLTGLLIALDLLGATALVTAVLGSAGVVGIVLGFAFRDMAENYLSGILLSLWRPFEPRDHVRIDAHEGRVVSLSTRNTVLMTLDGNELRLPNATVFKAVILNFTHNPRRRFSFSLVAGSGEDLQLAQDVGVATLAAMTGVLTDPGPSAAVDSIVDATATLSYFAWVDQRETDFGKARSEAIRLVRQALAQACIRPPEPVQRVELLQPSPAASAAAPAADESLASVDPVALARTQGDVSPSTELDEQLSQERARKADQDMLRAPGTQAD